MQTDVVLARIYKGTSGHLTFILHYMTGAQEYLKLNFLFFQCWNCKYTTEKFEEIKGSPHGMSNRFKRAEAESRCMRPISFL